MTKVEKFILYSMASMLLLLFVVCSFMSESILFLQKQTLKDLGYIETLQNTVLALSKNELANTVILTALSEDYPPKQSLGDREWCKDFSCLPAIDENYHD